MKCLALLLTCLPCFAQFPYCGVTWQQPSSGGFVLPGANQVLLRLKASDLPVGKITAGWTDEIHGVVFTNGTTATQPTNGPTGVRFASTWLMKQGTSFTGWFSSNAFFCVYQVDPNAGGWDTIYGADSSETGLGFNNSPANGWFMIGTISLTGPVPSNVMGDVIETGSGNPIVTYTNGILATSKSTGFTGFFNNLLGANQSGPVHNDFYNGYVQEIIVWSNYTLSSIDISNLHYYRTNIYGGSP